MRIRLGSGISDLLLPANRNKLVRQQFLVSFSLFGLDDLQYISEPLVGYDVGLGHTSILVKGTEGKTAPAVTEFNAS